MIKLFFSIFFLFTGLNNSFSQAWMNLISAEKTSSTNVSFQDIQKAFNTYWTGKNNERSHGWRQFKRWENFMEPRVKKSGKLLSNILWDEYLKTKNNKSNVANWTSLGPGLTPTDINFPQYKRGSGRINCVAFHPTDPNILWVGSPSGGLWKTSTGGSSWNTTTDDLLSIGVSDIAINPANPNVIYIATGDGDGSDTYSVGILKSTDGGVTWNPTGLSMGVESYTAFRKLIINSIDPNILLAASNNGIYKTTNGGNTWNVVQSGYFKDLVYKPGSQNEIYASSYNGYSGGAIYKSNNGGNSFSQLFTGMPSSEISRIALGVSPANPNIVYALCSNSSDDGFHSVYKSTNSGTNWTLCVNSTYGNLLGWQVDASGSGGQGWYDLAIAVSPTDANNLFIGGVNIWQSMDGGNNWAIDAHWSGDGGITYVHADQHILAFNNSNSTLYSGNDGGIYKKPVGTDWSDLSDGLQILQIYRLGNSATNPKVVVSGTQDNGSMKYKNGQWRSTLGGDGMEALIDFTDENIIYGEYYYGNIYKSNDGGLNFYSINPPDAPTGAWITPYVIDPSDHNTLLIGYKEVYKTTDGGSNWQIISTGMSSGINLQSLAIAASDANRIYAATSNNIWKTTNGGSSWIDITAGLPSEAITYICVSPTNPDKIWITFSGYTFEEKVYQSVNGGASWTNFSDGLPNIPTNCIVYENNSNDALYAGTDLGVYFRNSSMTQWIQFNTGLPNVIVNELEIQYSSRKLRAATYGRGLWESDLYELPGIPQSNFTYQIVSSCEGTVNFFSTATGVPTQWTWKFGDGTTSSLQNPSHIYTTLGIYPVKLIVSNSFGTDSILTTVNISALPVNAEFIADNISICSTPAEVHFTNQSANGLSFFWDFGDGYTSTEQNPSHIYNTDISYDVKLITYGGYCGTDSIIKQNMITVNPANTANQSMGISGISPLQTCCYGTLYDSGGQGYYQNNTQSILIIAPPLANKIVLNFTSFDFEPGPNGSCDYDYLAIYDGTYINAPLIGKYCNNNPPPTTITSTGGTITIEQYTDPGVTGIGFQFNWSCLTVGSNDNEITNNIWTVFPNPSNGILNLTFNENLKNIDLSVFDITGRKIVSNSYSLLETNNSALLNLNQYGKGIFLIQIKNSNFISHKVISIE